MKAMSRTAQFLVATGTALLVACATTAPTQSGQPAPVPKSGSKPAYVFHDTTSAQVAGPELVLVRSGTFRMGDPVAIGSSAPIAREVTIDRPFAVGKFEVTVADFRRFAEASGYKTDAERGNGCFTYSGPSKLWNFIAGTSWRQPGFAQADDHPVVCVSWNDAVAYTQWLSAQTGEKYRLPTEAEWEYIARAGTNTNYGFADTDECDNVNCCKTGVTWIEKQTRSVGSYVANPFGLHDTAGNVWEWTASEYSPQYDGSEQRSADPATLVNQRALRGGSWYSFAVDTRAGFRGKNWPQERYSTIGFRIVRDVTPEFVKNVEQTTGIQLTSLDR